MIALLAGELQRLLVRRMVRMLALLSVVAIALAGLLTFLNTEQVSDQELASRRSDAAARIEECRKRVEDRQATNPRDGTVGPGEAEGFCEFGPPAYVEDKRFELTDVKGILQGTTAAFVVVAWVIGASSIGADWQSRTITTLLTWESRRERVLLAKAAASVAVAVGFALLAGALLVLALLPAAFLHGTTAGTGGTFWRSVAGVVLRGEVLVAIAAALGFAVASIGRNTAAALGIGFAYFLVIENVVGSFLADYRRWLLLGNAIVLVAGEDEGGEVVGRTVLQAGIYLTVIAVLLIAAATVLFRRRDVA